MVVTKNNAYVGMKVKIKPNSRYSGQSSKIGKIVRLESMIDSRYCKVEFPDHKNAYQIEDIFDLIKVQNRWL